jgi:DNA repair protein RecN (Recombination protein N)
VLLELHIAPLEGTEDVAEELRPGPSVLTGETGAGKTMVPEGLALGRWAGAGPVRDGATEASLLPVDAARERS